MDNSLSFSTFTQTIHAYKHNECTQISNENPPEPEL